MTSIRVSSQDDPLVVWQSGHVEPEKKTSSFYESIEEGVLSAQKNLSSLVSLSKLKKCVYQPVYAASSVIKRIGEITYDVFSQIEDGVEMMMGKIPAFEGGVKVLKIISLPASFVNLVYNCYLSIYGKGSEKLDATLRAVEEFASVIGGTAVFCIGLEGLGVITKRVSSWLGPIAVTATVFSSMSILIHIRRYRKMQKLAEKFDQTVDLTSKVGEATLKDYRAFLTILEKKVEKKPEILRDCFYFSDKQMADRLIAIERVAQEMLSSSNTQVQQKGRELLYGTMKTLRGRIDHNMTSSVLAGVSAGIGIIGSVVFFACPAVPIGLAISGIGAVFGAANFIHQRLVDYQVMKQIGLERKWHEWITC